MKGRIEFFRKTGILMLVLVMSSTSSLDIVHAQTYDENDTQETDGIITIQQKDKSEGAIQPSVYDRSYEQMPSNPVQAYSTLPTSYRLNDKGLSTSVKSQDPWGSCWAFAALSSLESSLLMKGVTLPAEPDLSEHQLSWFTFDQQSKESLAPSTVGQGQVGEGQTTDKPGNDRLDEGGNTPMAVSQLATWQGSANETSIPYTATDGTMQIGSDWSLDESKRNDSAVQLTDAVFLPNPTIKEENGSFTYRPEATEYMKTAIMNSGALSIAYYADQSMPDQDSNDGTYFNYTNFAQNVDVSMTPNHSVTIVGWDDAYAKENFVAGHQPAGNGAWLVKNSWGSNWGLDGYFWLSYYDVTIEQATSYQGKVKADNEKIYQYDYLGLNSDYLYFGDEKGSVANVFTASDNELLHSVSAVINEPDTEVTIDVYKLKGDTLTLDNRVATQTEELRFAGYFTIELDTPVSLKPNEKFAVVETVKIKDRSQYFLPIETGYQPYNKRGVLNKGESYIIENDGTIIDLTDFPLNDDEQASVGNAMIKAFTFKEQEAPLLKSVTYEAYDKAGTSLEKKTISTIEEINNIELSPGVETLKLLAVETNPHGLTQILLGDTPYTIGSPISRAVFEAENGNISITTKADAQASKTHIYQFNFHTSPLVFTANGVTLTDFEHSLASGLEFKVDEGTSEEQAKIKSELEKLNASSTFKVYRLSLGNLTTLDHPLELEIKTSDEFQALDRTKLYAVTFDGEQTTLREVAIKNGRSLNLKADITSMGTYVLAESKQVATLPTISPMEYDPSRTLKDVKFPAVEGGVWTWDTPTSIIEAGTHSFNATFTPDADSIYEARHASITLTITKATPDISGITISSITYGDTLAQASINAKVTYKETNVKGTFVWKQPDLTPSVLDSDKTEYTFVFVPESSQNYESVEMKQTLSVHKKEIGIAIDDANKIYGEQNPIFHCSLAQGSTLVGSDTIDDLQITLATGATKHSGVGDYQINATAVSANYAVISKPGIFHITPRTLSAKANDVTLEYGEALPSHFTFTLQNFAEGDSIDSIRVTSNLGVIDYVDERTPGTYEIKIHDMKILSPNYILDTDLVSGTLTIREMGTKSVDEILNTSSLPNSVFKGLSITGKLSGFEKLQVQDSDADVAAMFKMETPEDMQIIQQFQLSLSDFKEGMDGKYTLQIPVSNDDNMKEVTVYHYLEKDMKNANNEPVEKAQMDVYEHVSVQDGMIMIDVYSLKNFAIAAQKPQEKPVEPDVKPDVQPDVKPDVKPNEPTPVPTDPEGNTTPIVKAEAENPDSDESGVITGDTTQTMYLYTILFVSAISMLVLLRKKSKKAVK